MANDFAQFKREVLRIEKEMIQDAEELQQSIVLTAHNLLASPQYSPIDKGRYIASHQFETKRGAETAPDGLNRSQYDTYIAKEEKQIKQQRFNFANAVYYIANNLAYAEALEGGRSKQAPGQNAIYGKVNLILQPIIKKKMEQFNKKVYK